MFNYFIFILSSLGTLTTIGQTSQSWISTYDPITGSSSFDFDSEDFQGNKSVQNLEFDPDLDCETDFFSVSTGGIVIRWRLENDTVIALDTLLTNSGRSLAYCNFNSEPTFYSTNFTATGITVFNQSNWSQIETDFPVLNSGGHENDQYFMGLVSGALRTIYKLEGADLILIDSLTGSIFTGSYFTVADLAVDVLGRAWALKGPSFYATDSLLVYDDSGLVNSYGIYGNGNGMYGSMFVNDIMYVGFSASNVEYPNSIVPIEVGIDSAWFGEPIPFTNYGFADLASCQEQSHVVTSSPKSRPSIIQIHPNPSFNGDFTLELGLDSDKPKKLKVINMIGRIIQKKTIKGSNSLIHIDKAGTYILLIEGENSILRKKIVILK